MGRRDRRARARTGQHAAVARLAPWTAQAPRAVPRVADEGPVKASRSCRAAVAFSRCARSGQGATVPGQLSASLHRAAESIMHSPWTRLQPLPHADQSETVASHHGLGIEANALVRHVQLNLRHRHPGARPSRREPRECFTAFRTASCITRNSVSATSFGTSIGMPVSSTTIVCLVLRGQLLAEDSS